MRVYVSSTSNDLQEDYRPAVMAAIKALRHDYIAMEDYTGDDRLPVEKCLEDVAGCDLYIGIFAWRYGYVPVNHSRSITELEYRKALEQGIPTLIFLLDEDVPWLPKYVDGGEMGTRPIDVLRAEFQKLKLVSFFKSPADLRAKAAEAIANAIKKLEERLSPSAERVLLPGSHRPKVFVSYLPVTGAARFGRSKEMQQLDDAWHEGHTNVLTLVAWGGVLWHGRGC